MILSSGNYVEDDMLSITPELKIYEGYDTSFWGWGHEAEPKFTAEDMREIADEQIDRWRRFKEALPAA